MVLCPVIRKLLHKRVVLASASPRRREILSQAGLRFEVVPSRFKEMLDKASFPTPCAYAVETAKQKALEVAHRMHLDSRTADLVIGADTIVTVSGLILEKPVDKQDAYRMLSSLSGREHSVFTGVALVLCSVEGSQLETHVVEFHEETRVTFSELSQDMLWDYIHSGEPMDKAGGYGIQALGGMLVERVSGDFLNVVGFPLNHFCKELAQLYLPPPREALRRRVQHGSIPPVDTFDDDATEPPGASSRQGGACNGAVGATPPFPWKLLELMEGFKGSQVLFTACRLAVFDALKDGAVHSAADVACRINACLPGTEWLLDACAELGLLEKQDEGYCNAEVTGLFLVSGSSHALKGLLGFCDGLSRHAFSDLESAVRQGGDLLHRVAAGHRPGASCKTCEPANKATQWQLTAARQDLARLSARAVATAFDLSRFTSACHVGGATAALAHGLAQECPHLQVTVFDHPEVIKLAQSEPAPGKLASCVHFVAGDCFTDELPEAALYVLCCSLEGRPEDAVQGLLSRLADRCRPGGGLLLADTLEEEEEEEEGRPSTLARARRAWGARRSARDYERLLAARGFREVRAVRTGALLDAVLAVR